MHVVCTKTQVILAVDEFIQAVVDKYLILKIFRQDIWVLKQLHYA